MDRYVRIGGYVIGIHPYGYSVQFYESKPHYLRVEVELPPEPGKHAKIIASERYTVEGFYSTVRTITYTGQGFTYEVDSIAAHCSYPVFIDNTKAEQMILLGFSEWCKFNLLEQPDIAPPPPPPFV